MKKKIALFSVNELKDIVAFGRVLAENGWSIVATDSAHDMLRGHNIQSTAVSDFVGHSEKYKFPPTMHPKMEAALTQNDYPERIELVYNITYGPDEGMDVGGNALLAMAIKGNRVPVSSLAGMKRVVEAIEKSGELPQSMRSELQREAANEIADYYCSIAENISSQKLNYYKTHVYFKLLNGENPYQEAEILNMNSSDDPLALTQHKLISSNKPCYTNMADLDSLTESITKLSCALYVNFKKAPFVTIASKHGNACGIGIDYDSKAEAVKKALWGNPVSIWGGEVITNFKIGGDEAGYLFSSAERKERLGSEKWMLDVISAPEFDNQAFEKLSQRSNTKIFVNQNLCKAELQKHTYSYRFTRGSILRQTPADYIIDFKELNWSQSLKDTSIIADLIIAWTAAYSSFHGGNEVALAKNGQLLCCAGGPSTVDAAQTAVARAKKIHGTIHGAVFAADAFFPFIDAPAILVDAGVKGGVVPAGGVQFSKVKDYFTDNKISVGFVPEKYRGFCRH